MFVHRLVAEGFTCEACGRAGNTSVDEESKETRTQRRDLSSTRSRFFIIACIILDSLRNRCTVKGELNLDKKWQSDDLFYIIMNKIHPRFNQCCVILKLS